MIKLTILTALLISVSFASPEVIYPELETPKIDTLFIKKTLDSAHKMYLIHRQSMIDLGMDDVEFNDFVNRIKALKLEFDRKSK